MAHTFSDFALMSALQSWQTAQVTNEATDDAILERLRQVLHQLKFQPAKMSPKTLIGLIRHWQLRKSARGETVWLRVPVSPDWPSTSEWRGGGFDVVESQTTLEVKARPVRISWLGDQNDLFDDVFAEVRCRQDLSVASDPLVKRQLGRDTCLSEGQREALRALVHLPPEVTLIANLPTGSGKSALAQLTPFLHGEGRLVLTIVPTVALAIDQAERMNELFRANDSNWQFIPLSFHSGMSADQRQQVFQAIRSGSQRILFTSPESATGSLRESLEGVAEQGGLTHIVIDEAHLVATWGSGFRPQFQLLPALIRRLREISHAKTGQWIKVILASATLTKGTIRVLQQHFGPGRETEVISGVHLRAEPRYAFKFCGSIGEQQRLVVELVTLAPRPFIVYVTRPDEAESLCRLLRAEGIGRIEHFTGETGATEREMLLKRWKSNTLDGMIATSAFGLGVDKADVRTVIHATLPESLDRFYQEVGRSGRDGSASVSILLFTEEDIAQARGMSTQKLIGNALGLQRWKAMINDPQPRRSGLDQIWVDLDALHEGLHQHSPANRAWSIRTLNLMALAGLLEITALQANSPTNVGADAEINSEEDAFFASIKILEVQHQSENVFNTKMDLARTALLRSSQVGVKTLLDVARGSIEISEALRQTYELTLNDAIVPVSICCGGCPVHWKNRADTKIYRRPVSVRTSRFSVRSNWRSLAPTLPMIRPNVLVLTYTQEDIRSKEFGSVIKSLLLGIEPHTMLVPRTSGAQWFSEIQALVASLRSDVFIDRYDSDEADSYAGGVQEVRLLVWTEHQISREARTAVWFSRCDFTVWLIPHTASDPDRPDRLWSSVVPYLSLQKVQRKFAG